MKTKPRSFEWPLYGADTELNEPLVNRIAQVCHEANGAWCRLLGEHQPTWDEAPDWQRDSALAGVRAIILAKLGNKPYDARDSHDSWTETKIAEGWVFGPVKDPERKTHPCLRPYRELPMHQRVKDSIFLGIVTSFLQFED